MEKQEKYLKINGSEGVELLLDDLTYEVVEATIKIEESIHKNHLYCFLGTLAYLVVAAPICWMCLHIPAVNIDNKLFRMVYKRGDTHYTSYFQFGKLAYYWIMFLVGPTFVNIITLDN